MNSREFERLKIKDMGKGCLQGFIWDIEAPGDGLLSMDNLVQCSQNLCLE